MFPFWLILAAGAAISTIIFLMATWRWMRAHERLARHVSQLVDVLREQHRE